MSKPLARAIVDFREAIAASDLHLPEDVVAVMRSVDNAVHSPDPQTAINKSFANLRRLRPGCFYHLHLWLQRPEIQGNATIGGAYWAWRVWRSASFQIHNNTKASDAFGMNQNGRPKSAGFTCADDAAMYAALQRRTLGGTLKDGITTAATLYGARVDLTKKSYTWARHMGTEDLRLAVADGAEKRS